MRYNEIIKESADNKPYVVIINHGRGQQEAWPRSDAPEVYSQAEAQAIVDKELARQNAFNGVPGKGHAHWHAQPLEHFKNYVARGNVCYNRLEDLLMSYEGHGDNEKDY
jgi:hypothetical protein